MTVYAESSSVLRWLLDEARADEIHGLLRGATKVVCSRLTLVETRRVIRRAVAETLLDEVGGMAILEVLARAAAGWAVLEVSRDVAERAEGSFPVEPVRTLDALHLASALLLRQALPDLRLLSSDDRVRANGRRLGFEVVPA
ncbi:MAG TPA: PIN domain-containing protein [Candidatus Binatia bacterium]|nr:PIN domain-containing protein [Candidatus Binatia bacterium]